jgi:hypothetical protein
MRSDIRPGGVFPDYKLPDHTNWASANTRVMFVSYPAGCRVAASV